MDTTAADAALVKLLGLEARIVCAKCGRVIQAGAADATPVLVLGACCRR